MANCEYCGKHFRAKTNAKFCSDSHKQAAYRLRKSEARKARLVTFTLEEYELFNKIVANNNEETVANVHVILQLARRDDWHDVLTCVLAIKSADRKIVDEIQSVEK